MTGAAIFPELVTGREDQFTERGWIIKPGWALRGHASCDFVARILEVPLGDSGLDRVIRAHEMMHLRVSPHDVNPLAVHTDIVSRALECAEEFRVNELLGRVGFDVDELSDGTESNVALRLAAMGAWDEAVYFYVATMGTKAEREFLKGVRRGAPTWVKALGVVRRRVRALADVHSVDVLASTQREAGDAHLPRGFEIFTVPLARLIAGAANAEVPIGAERLRQFRRSLEPGGRRAPTGRFASLVFDDALSYDAVAVRYLSRRPRADVSGTAVRYPSRLLTDPQRRAFVRSRRASGGVVVIDQSGSMDLDHGDLDRLLTATPGATVVGYSHRPGDTTGRANAWVIAREGRTARDLPSGNVGNGVDGPVLRWAIRTRRSHERVIWVTDGQITDSNDHPSDALSLECAQLVRAHRVVMVRTLDEATRILRGRLHGLESPVNFGRVGREIQRFSTVTALR